MSLSAGLHPSDTSEHCWRHCGNCRAPATRCSWLLHDLDIVRSRQSGLVDVGPGAGQRGAGEVLYSGPLAGLRGVTRSQTAHYLFEAPRVAKTKLFSRRAEHWLTLKGIHRNNLRGVDVAFPLGVMTVVTGVSGAGKSSLISQALVDLLSDRLVGPKAALAEADSEEPALIEEESTRGVLERQAPSTSSGW